jgi:ribosomal protein S18 acetylase RimI-like enzyme
VTSRPATPDVSAVDLLRIRRRQWRLLREVRLCALEDAPAAFLSHGDEHSWGRRRWRAEVSRARWLMAVVDGEVVGVAGVVQEPGDVEPYLVSMWVRPHHRGSGIARQLSDRLTSHSPSRDAHGVRLWVIEGNDVARQVYERMGFQLTGRSQYLPGDRSRMEYEMRRALPRPVTAASRYRVLTRWRVLPAAGQFLATMVRNSQSGRIRR